MSELEQTTAPKVRLVMRQPAQEHEQEEPGRQPAVQVQRDPLAQVGCREGDASCAGAHASTLSRATGAQPARARGSLLRLQREYGNRYVRRVVDLSRKGQGEGDVTPEVEAAIQRERGGGQSLDSAARAQMEPAMGADFSGVRVHTGEQADTLNRDLSARAFTTGQDIFFKQGEYSPGSSSGRELLAHELTHVVQQDGDRVRRKLTVGAAGDPYEREADQVASSVMRQEHQPDQQDTLHRQGAPEEEEKKKEEEPVQMKLQDGSVQRQAEEEKKEEEPVQTKLDDGQVQRQVEEEKKKEEEPVQMKLQDGSLQRQAEEEKKEEEDEKSLQMRRNDNQNSEKIDLNANQEENKATDTVLRHGAMQVQTSLWGEQSDVPSNLYASRKPANDNPYYGSLNLGEGSVQLQNGQAAPKEAWKPCNMPGKGATLDPGFSSKLDNICGRMQAEGHPTRIAWGRRTLEQQVEIYARGRTFAQFKTGLLAEAQKGHLTAQEAQAWIDHYDPKVGKNSMPKGPKSPVTWTLRSAHLTGKAADVIHPKLGWGAGAKYWKALEAAAQAEGLQIGLPVTDKAHVQDPNPWK